MATLTDDSVVLLYDPANAIYGDNVDCSQPIKLPKYISIDGLNNTSDFIVEAKLHPNAAWQEIDTVDKTVPNAMIAMDNPPTMVRLRRVSGSNNVVVYAKR